VRAADPHVTEGQLDPRIQLVDLCEEEVAAADAVVLLTDHDAFDYAIVLAHAAYVLDTRGRLVGDQVEHL
jgi:UDP-N-acetyl-D-glucosamine dehydrogenase